jgi:hypothetical protein
VAVRLRGVAGEIPPLMNGISNPCRETGAGTMVGRRFDWGGRLPKSNGGARRSPRGGWKSSYECKGTRRLDCEIDISSRYESRS